MPTILFRRISPYLAADVLLEVFGSAEEAGSHRDAYFAARTSDPASDPWREQPHKPEGLVPADLIVRNFEGPGVEAGAATFVVSSYLDGLGQLVRKFLSVHADRGAAEKQAASLREADDASFPSYFHIQEVRVGELLSDALDAQRG